MRVNAAQLRALINEELEHLNEDHYEVGSRVKLCHHPQYIGSAGQIVRISETGWGERYHVDLDDGPIVVVNPSSLEKE